jgi:hypothetical protein
MELESPETTLINSLTIEKLLDTLNEEDRAVLVDLLKDNDPSILFRVRGRRLIHRLAILAGAKQPCQGSCGQTLPASGFGWNGWVVTKRRLCLDCEPKHQLYDRLRIEKWLRSVEQGRTWACSGCNEVRPALDYNFKKSVSICLNCVKGT